MYADDTVIFYANEDPTVIENQLNKYMENAKRINVLPTNS